MFPATRLRRDSLRMQWEMKISIPYIPDAIEEEAMEDALDQPASPCIGYQRHTMPRCQTMPQVQTTINFYYSKELRPSKPALKKESCDGSNRTTPENASGHMFRYSGPKMDPGRSSASSLRQGSSVRLVVRGSTGAPGEWPADGPSPNLDLERKTGSLQPLRQRRATLASGCSPEPSPLMASGVREAASVELTRSSRSRLGVLGKVSISQRTLSELKDLEEI